MFGQTTYTGNLPAHPARPPPPPGSTGPARSSRRSQGSSASVSGHRARAGLLLCRTRGSRLSPWPHWQSQRLQGLHSKWLVQVWAP